MCSSLLELSIYGSVIIHFSKESVQNMLLVERGPLESYNIRRQACRSCLYEPVGVAWAWRLKEKKGAGQDSVARLGATWLPWFFPMFPSLHSVMNGFLLVCGRGLRLKSILTKAQNTHPSKPTNQSATPSASLRPGLWALPTTSPPATNWLCKTLSFTSYWNERTSFCL